MSTSIEVLAVENITLNKEILRTLGNQDLVFSNPVIIWLYIGDSMRSQIWTEWFQVAFCYTKKMGSSFSLKHKQDMFMKFCTRLRQHHTDDFSFEVQTTGYN